MLRRRVARGLFVVRPRRVEGRYGSVGLCVRERRYGSTGGAVAATKTRITELLTTLRPAVRRAAAVVKDTDAALMRADAWDNAARAARISAAHHSAQAVCSAFAELSSEADAAFELWEEGKALGDRGIVGECEAAMAALVPQLHDLLVSTTLTAPEDQGACVVEVHAGAGGADSFDWAAMLIRMYTAWATANDLSVAQLETAYSGTPGGIRHASIRVSGERAYGYLKAEAGVHRLVRVSPFDAAKRRHTSFARVCCFPDVVDDDGDKLDLGDVTVDTFRASGPGGQHVNTTDSAVRVVHVPTGTTAVCQNERSQRRNKEAALAVLRAKLHAQHQAARGAAHDAVVASAGPNEWGSQIRSYVLHPYRLVKDHRTLADCSDPVAMLTSGDGLTSMMEAALLLTTRCDDVRPRL